jgi:hypothetical protein
VGGAAAVAALGGAPQLHDDVDAARLARFIIATLEGALLMARVHRDAAALEGHRDDLKRFVATHVRVPGTSSGSARGGRGPARPASARAQRRAAGREGVLGRSGRARERGLERADGARW